LALFWPRAAVCNDAANDADQKLSSAIDLALTVLRRSAARQSSAFLQFAQHRRLAS
jgi:hypothetical protein